MKIKCYIKINKGTQTQNTNKEKRGKYHEKY